MWVLYKKLLEAPAVSSTDSIPAGFCCQKIWGLIFLALEPWAVGLVLLAPEIPLPNFYLPHADADVGSACSMSLPLLLVWMEVVSLIL